MGSQLEKLTLFILSLSAGHPGFHGSVIYRVVLKSMLSKQTLAKDRHDLLGFPPESHMCNYIVQLHVTLNSLLCELHCTSLS